MHRKQLLLTLAALSFIPTLFFYMVGEEGIYTISTLEMWQGHSWFIQTLYGINLQRPPLMNWLAVPIANLLGWSHVLIAIRLLSVAATLGMAAWLYWLCRKLFADRDFALFAALACLSLADLQLYRGWLAYTDPLFAFLTFGAMATLWVASVNRHRRLLLMSVLLVSCALLTKAFTAYIFYGTVILVLLGQRGTRQFLLSPASLLILCSTLVAPYAWFSSLPHQGAQSSSMMLNEIIMKLATQDVPGYLQRLFIYPLETLFWLSPVALLAVYLIARKRVWLPEPAAINFQGALFITALTILPYWLAPQGGIRYLLPVYPMVALVGARYIWRSGEPSRKLALRWFTGLIAFKFLFALVLFPWYQNNYRGANYVATAHLITKRTEGYPLYGKDFRSTGENIIGQIDIDRLPLPAVKLPPDDWDNGFWLGPDADEKIGKLVEKFVVAKDEIYLLCRGTACPTGTRP